MAANQTTQSLKGLRSVEAFQALVPGATDISVAWGEMDAFGHINNAHYFRYFETARIAYLHATGLFAMLQKHGIGPILAATSARYLKPVVFPDTLAVSAAVVKVHDAGFSLQHIAFSRAQMRAVVMGEADVVLFDYARQSAVGLPDDIRARLVED